MKHKSGKRIKQKSINKSVSLKEKEDQEKSDFEIKPTKIIGGTIFATFFISWFFSGFGTTMVHELFGKYLIQVYGIVISLLFILLLLNLKLIIIGAKRLIKIIISSWKYKFIVILEVFIIWFFILGIKLVFPMYFNSKYNVAQQEFINKSYEKAVYDIDSLMPLTEKIMGNNSPLYVKCLIAKASASIQLSKFTQAKGYLNNARELAEQNLSPDMANIYVNCLNIYGTLSYSTGNYANALRYHLDALDKYKQSNSTNDNLDLSYISLIYYISEDNVKLGNYNDAINIYVSENLLQKAYDSKRYDLITDIINNNSLLSMETSNLSDINYFYNIMYKLTDIEKDDVGLKINTANLAGELKKFDVAKQLLEQSNSLLDKKYGTNYFQNEYALYYNSYGNLLMSLGDNEQNKSNQKNLYLKAQEQFLRSYQVRKEIYKEFADKEDNEIIYNDNYAVALNNLGVIYQKVEYYESAQVYFEKLKKIRGQVLGTEHILYAQALFNTGFVCEFQNKLPEAINNYIECKKIRERFIDIKTAEYFNLEERLILTYNKAGMKEKAKKELSDILSLIESRLGKDSSIYKHFLSMLE